jgi:hypothetical protein
MSKLKMFIILISISYACGKEGKYAYKIQNNSNKKFSVFFKPWDGDSSLIEINPDSNITFYTLTTNGSAPVDRGINFLNPFQSIELINKDSIQLKNDFHLRESWSFYWGKGDGSYLDGVSEYTFSINSSDIIVE